jgi:hypothetical protein
MYKLILKVKECRRTSEGFMFICKDKFNIEYMFISKCFKACDSYIQVTFNKYNLVASLATAEQIELRDIKYINELEIINNKLMLNNKQVQCNILKEVEKHITRHTVAELEKLIKECQESYTYADHIDMMRKYETSKNNYIQELKRLKIFLKIA